jgi:tetratricopeptide (TPR) repeat protein
MSTPADPPSYSDLIRCALQFVQDGRLADANAVLANVLSRNPGYLDARALLGAVTFRQQRYADAVAAFQVCIAANPTHAELHFSLGAALEKAGNLPGAINAFLAACHLDPRNWRACLFAGTALEAVGRRNEAAVVLSLGDEADQAIRTAKENPTLDTEIRQRSALADRVLREHFTRLQARALDDYERCALEAGRARPDLWRVRSAMWTQTHAGPFRYRTPMQQPSIFYMPDLEALPVTSRERLAWAAAVEKTTEDIRREYLAAVAANVPLAPYVDANTKSPIWQTLRGKTDWSALHLFKGAEERPIARLFPRTLEALQVADVVRVEGGKPIELFFSRLKPGAHIPPHFGAANSRLTVHLPLIVPDDCAIRVGNEVHNWRPGEIFAFDDSFEHEAWNRSATDRVVLIFEAHRPDVQPEERAAMEHAFDARGRWLKQRRLPNSEQVSAIAIG